MTTITELQSEIAAFVRERDWEEYHSSKNLSMAIACEAAELMELYCWQTDGLKSFKPIGEQDVRNEVADIAIFLLSFCSKNKIDLAKAIRHKIKMNAFKYPVKVK